MHMTPRNSGMAIRRVVFVFGQPMILTVPVRSRPMPRPVAAVNQHRTPTPVVQHKEPEVVANPDGTASVVNPITIDTTHIGIFLAFLFCAVTLWFGIAAPPLSKPTPVVLEEERKPNESWDQHVRRLVSTNLSGVNVADLKDSQVECLAKNIYFESRGQPLEGQVGVAKVTLNRLEQGWAKTVCGVVYQKIIDDVCQFSWVCNNENPRPSGYDWRLAVGIARTMLTHGEHVSDPTGGATHFHATYIQPAWKVLMTGAHQIGDHIFYRMKSKN